jgi:hypothetical protein
MSILDWFFGSPTKNKASTNNNPRGKITVAKAMAFSKEYEKVKKLANYLNHCINQLALNEPKIEAAIEEMKSKTNQEVDKEKLLKEILIVRYSSLFVFFFDFNFPKSQKDLEMYLKLFEHCFESTLALHGKTNYLSWLKMGFAEYAGTDKFEINSLKSVKSSFMQKIAEKIPSIAFDCTGGRLGGELHDSIIELIMTTVQRDQKIFSLSDNTTLTSEETENIKSTIEESGEQSKKAGEEFINELLNQ